MSRTLKFSCVLVLGSFGLAACGGPVPVEDDAAVPAATLREGAPVAYATVYEAVSYSPGLGAPPRAWIPVDLAAHPNGDLWVVQQMERNPLFDDETECDTRGLSGGPNDCHALQGSTVGLRDPGAAEPATAENGRANLVVDWNALHFMRRPAAIAFGARELVLESSGPGGAEAGLTAPATYVDTFATCHEHWTGNPTDTGEYIGPSLWTSDPSIYNGVNGTFEWSNGSHLDMVHATPYCMGIAYERDNVYWTFNGDEGVLDRYDFGAPHFPGFSDHDDGDVTRYNLRDGATVVRVPTVPSNMILSGDHLYIADSGNGRVLRIDITAPVTEFGTFRTHDELEARVMDDLAFEAVLDTAALEAAWGGSAVPSGLAMLDERTLVVANHASGHITLFDLDGTPARTLDTGLGAGLGGLTVIDGTIYFAHLTERRVYRIDVVAP